MVIQYNNSTVHLFWSETEQSYMYTIWKNKLMTEQQIEELEGREIDGDDGGICTGTMKNALEMAGIDEFEEVDENEISDLDDICACCDKDLTYENYTQEEKNSCSHCFN